MTLRTILLPFFLLVVCVLPGTVLAQSMITGTVTDKYLSLLAGATIQLKGTRISSTSDSAGNFRIGPVAKGNATIFITYTGYKKFEQTVVVGDSAIILSVILTESGMLGEVVVTAGSFEASDKAKGASLTPMDAVTNAGSNGDLANAMRARQGAQQVGEREGLFVRGGSGEEAKQFMDGAWIRNPNLSPVSGVPQYSRISPFLFKGILFSTGGYSALYGQAMSSALILESVDLVDKSSASLSIFPMSLGAGFQQLAKDHRSSYGVGVRYGHLSLYNSVIPQQQDYFRGPEYLMADANWHGKTGRTGMLKIYVNYAYNNVGMRNPDIDSLALKSGYSIRGRNLFSTISYRTALPHNWKLDLTAAYTFNRDEVHNSLLDGKNETVTIPGDPFGPKNSSIASPSHFAQGRVVLQHGFARSQAIRFGGEHFYSDDRTRYNDTLTRLQDHLTAAFAETDLRLAPGIAAKLGWRFEYSSLLNQATLAPRISLAWRWNNYSQLNLAYGVFYQKPENQYLMREPSLSLASAEHYIINYTRKEGNRLLRVEAYYKKYRKLVSTDPVYDNDGTGYAKGIELFWRDKKTIRNLDYWITYTYLDTKRKFLDYPYSLQPSFATPHTLAIVAKRFFPGINTSFNLAWYMATGRPYYEIRTDPATLRPMIYDQGTTRMYNTLNFSAAWLFSFFKHWKNKDFSGIGFGVNNLLGTKQVFGYNYSMDGRNKLPVTLPATRMVYIGLFVNLGIDRRNDLINENL